MFLASAVLLDGTTYCPTRCIFVDLDFLPRHKSKCPLSVLFVTRSRFVATTIMIITVDNIVVGLSNDVHVSEWSIVNVHNDHIFDVDIYYGVHV